jgi:hypothetical protein
VERRSVSLRIDTSAQPLYWTKCRRPASVPGPGGRVHEAFAAKAAMTRVSPVAVRCFLIVESGFMVMVVMDVFTRRIIGFGVERADPCGVSVCRMFNQIVAGESLPRYLSWVRVGRWDTESPTNPCDPQGVLRQSFSTHAVTFTKDAGKVLSRASSSAFSRRSRSAWSRSASPW